MFQLLFICLYVWENVRNVCAINKLTYNKRSVKYHVIKTHENTLELSFTLACCTKPCALHLNWLVNTS